MVKKMLGAWEFVANVQDMAALGTINSVYAIQTCIFIAYLFVDGQKEAKESSISM